MVELGRGLILVALASALTAGAAVARDREIVLHMDDISLRAQKSDKIGRKEARKVLGAGRTAFATVANHFVLNSRSIFLFGSDRPPWAKWDVRRDPRIWILMGETLRTKDMGADAYLKRMQRGELEIYVPAPEDDPTPDDLHRLYREVCHAILAQTSWCACPLWLREGVAEYFGAVGSKGGHAQLASFKEELKEGGGDYDLGELLATTSREKWGRAGGRAVSWALVTMMEQTSKKLVPSLFNQSRLLLNHLKKYPSTATVEKEFARIVHSQLKDSGLTNDRLKHALTAWVAADFPKGSAYRRTEAHKIIGKGKPPRAFGMGLAGRFGVRRSATDEKGVFHIYQPFTGGSATWRFPWSAHLEVWIGVRGRPGTNYGMRPKAKKDGYFLDCSPMDVPRSGKTRLSARILDIPTGMVKWGFIWAGVTSPEGLGFLYRQEYKLK